MGGFFHVSEVIFFNTIASALPIQPIYLENGPNGLNWQCSLAVSSKTAPRILIFSIALCADYLFHMTSITTFTLIFFGYIISVYAIVKDLMCNHVLWVIVLR